MGLVSPSQSNAGDTIEASDINNPINQIAAVINGNIDATNIADNSITTAKLASNTIAESKIDWSTFNKNIKFAATTSLNNPTNGADTNLGGSGAQVSFTVASACTAFVTVNVATTSTSDFENKPEILLDGVVAVTSNYSAAAGNASNRSIMRSISSVVTLTAGTHVLAAGVFISSATSASVPSGAANITAIVLGNVTA